MSTTRQLMLLVALSVVCVVCGGLPLPGLSGPSAALAQQFKDPFQFKVHNNSTAASIAIYLKQIQDGGTATTSSSTTDPSSAGLGALTQYNSTTIGNMTEITTILEQGAEGYVSTSATQDGSNSSQSASSEGTQIYGGNTTLGGDIANAQATTNNGTTSDGSTNGTSQ